MKWLTNSNLYNWKLEEWIWGTNDRCNNKTYYWARYGAENHIHGNEPPGNRIHGYLNKSNYHLRIQQNKEERDAIFTIPTFSLKWQLGQVEKKSNKEAEAKRPTALTWWKKPVSTIFNSTPPTIKHHNNTIHTPFKSFLPLAGKMLTLLEAIRNPMKHIVKTLAIGNTAIIMVPNNDSPPTRPSMAASVDKNLSTVSNTAYLNEANCFTHSPSLLLQQQTPHLSHQTQNIQDRYPFHQSKFHPIESRVLINYEKKVN